MDQTILLADMAAGDQRAFKIIYNHYHNRLYAYAQHLVKSDVLAEDIIQEAFLKLWIKGATATEIINIESFLVTIVRNRALDILRRIKLENKTTSERQNNWTELHNETEERIMLNEGRRILQQGIDQLSPQQKMVYELCYRQGMKYEEAAKALQLSPETVKSYMKTALKNLRKFIADNSDLAALAIILKIF